MGKKSGSGIRIRDEHPGSYFRELRNNFLGEILKCLDADPVTRDLGWGKKSDSGSVINIPDPQHCRK
jgi:hypothetical protein